MADRPFPLRFLAEHADRFRIVQVKDERFGWYSALVLDGYYSTDEIGKNLADSAFRYQAEQLCVPVGFPDGMKDFGRQTLLGHQLRLAVGAFGVPSADAQSGHAPASYVIPELRQLGADKRKSGVWATHHRPEECTMSNAMYVSVSAGYQGHREAIDWAKSNGLSASKVVVDMVSE
jgi:hypothetical protein